jgi:hypothetical protein
MDYKFVSNQQFCKVSLRTLENWMKFCDKILSAILPFVKHLTAGVVLESLGILSYLSLVDSDSKVDINPFVKRIEFKNMNNNLKQRTLIGKGGKLSWQEKVAIVKKNDKLSFLSKSSKAQSGRGRGFAWQEQRDFVVSEIKRGWETGWPLTVDKLKDRLRNCFNDLKSTFAVKFLQGNVTCGNKLSKFISSMLMANRWSRRKNTVSQEIPLNWKELAISVSNIICQHLFDTNPEQIVFMDETFGGFYPSESTVIAPVNSCQVYSDEAFDNEKQGATLVVSCELFSSALLKPFIVMTGTWGGVT